MSFKNEAVRSCLRRFTWFGALVALCLSGSLLGAAGVLAQEYDLVIRNGRVLDGGGNPWVRADVAIRDGRLAAIGHVSGKGKRELDAQGLYVAPGFIDMMDQSGSVLLRHGLAENKLRMGVTTLIGGEGGTPPLGGNRSLDEGASRVAEFFDVLTERGMSVNFGSYFSATQARMAVLGMDSREPNSEELKRMQAIMREAMQAGALGMTTALIYPPSSFSTTDELVALAKIVAESGGLYASHIRGEGKELVEAVSEAIEIGERGGVPVEIFHLKAAYQPGWGTLMGAALTKIREARARGVDVAADLYPYTAGGTGLEATIPSWAFEGGSDALRERLLDKETRARLAKEIETGSSGWWNIVEASGGWHNVVLVNAQNPENARFHNMNLQEIAEATGKAPHDAAWDLVLEGNGRVMAIYHMMSDQDIDTALQEPWVSIGSDAGAAVGPGEGDDLGLPHPRAYGTHPRVLAYFSRERGVLSFEDAVRRMTSWPAARMGLADRGALKEGLWADVVVFDKDRIRDEATWEEPTRFSVGVRHVLVNGELVLEDGRHTGAMPGQVLLGPGRR